MGPVPEGDLGRPWSGPGGTGRLFRSPRKGLREWSSNSRDLGDGPLVRVGAKNGRSGRPIDVSVLRSATRKGRSASIFTEDLGPSLNF